jgi:hypothetical protein
MRKESSPWRFPLQGIASVATSLIKQWFSCNMLRHRRRRRHLLHTRRIENDEHNQSAPITALVFLPVRTRTAFFATGRA